MTCAMMQIMSDVFYACIPQSDCAQSFVYSYRVFPCFFPYQPPEHPVARYKMKCFETVSSFAESLVVAVFCIMSRSI